MHKLVYHINTYQTFRDEVKQIIAEKDKDFDGYLSFEE